MHVLPEIIRWKSRTETSVWLLKNYKGENRLCSNDRYVSPLSERYASREMQYHFFTGHESLKPGENCGLLLQRQRKSWGLPITDEQIEELKAHAEDINYDVAKAKRKGSQT